MSLMSEAIKLAGEVNIVYTRVLRAYYAARGENGTGPPGEGGFDNLEAVLDHVKSRQVEINLMMAEIREIRERDTEEHCQAILAEIKQITEACKEAMDKE